MISHATSWHRGTHATSWHHVIDRSYDIMICSSLYYTSLPSFVTIDILVAEIYYKTTWFKGHVAWWVGDSQGKSASYQHWWLWHCGTGDIMVLFCHLISQDHAIKESCDFTGGSFSWYVTKLPTLVIIAIVVVEFIIYQVYSSKTFWYF